MNFAAMILCHQPPMQGENNHNDSVIIVSTVQELSADTLLTRVREIWPSARYRDRVGFVEVNWYGLSNPRLDCVPFLSDFDKELFVVFATSVHIPLEYRND